MAAVSRKRNDDSSRNNDEKENDTVRCGLHIVLPCGIYTEYESETVVPTVYRAISQNIKPKQDRKNNLSSLVLQYLSNRFRTMLLQQLADFGLKVQKNSAANNIRYPVGVTAVLELPFTDTENRADLFIRQINFIADCQTEGR